MSRKPKLDVQKEKEYQEYLKYLEKKLGKKVKQK